MELSFLPLLTESDWVAYGVRRGIEALCAAKHESSSQKTIADHERSCTVPKVRDHGGTLTGDEEQPNFKNFKNCDQFEKNQPWPVPETDVQQECEVDSVAANFAVGHPVALLLSGVAITALSDSRRLTSPLDWGGELPCTSSSSQPIETTEGETLGLIYGRGSHSTKDAVSNRGPCSKAPGLEGFEGLQRSSSSNCRAFSKTRETSDERKSSLQLNEKSDIECEALGTRWLDAAWKTLNLSSDTAVQKQRLQILEHRAQTGAVSVSDQERKHCALLEREKERVKKELKAFDQHFARVYGKPPAHANKEPLRPLYTYYRRVKAALAHLQKAAVDRGVDESQPRRPRSEEPPQEKAKWLSVESGNQEQEDGACDYRREESKKHVAQRGSGTVASFLESKEDNRDSQGGEYEYLILKGTPDEGTRLRGRSSQRYDRKLSTDDGSFEHFSGALEKPPSQGGHTASTGGPDVIRDRAGGTSRSLLQKHLKKMEGVDAFDVNRIGHSIHSRGTPGRFSGQALFVSETQRGSRNASLPATRQSQRNFVIATRKGSSMEMQSKAVESTRLSRPESVPSRSHTLHTRSSSGKQHSTSDICRKPAGKNQFNCLEGIRKESIGGVEEFAAENLGSVYNDTSEQACFEEKLPGMRERTASLHNLRKEGFSGHIPQSFRLQKGFLSWEM